MRFRTVRFLGLTWLLLAALAGRGRSDAQTLTFEQLSWEGLSTTTPYSSWGFANLDFVGYSQDQFFNLNVNGNWVVQNMGIGSLYGSGVAQTVRTAFDLGNVTGTPVSSLNFIYSITSNLQTSIPVGLAALGAVNGISYQIGGEGGVDTGSPGAAPAPVNKPGKPKKSARLPNIDKFDNQVQIPYECAPAAVSNSLKYLQATGNLSTAVPSSISYLRTLFGTTATGSPVSWMETKRDHYAKYGLVTEFVDGYGENEINKIIKAVNEGRDVELRLDGHVEVVAGVRYYEDGTVELDLFDDNQSDNKKDPMHTSVIKNGMIDGKAFGRFIIESVPEPSTFAMLFAGLGAFGVVLGRRRART